MVRDRVSAISETTPLAYRRQNGGDYDQDLVLRPHLTPGATGLGVHTTPVSSQPSARGNRLTIAVWSLVAAIGGLLPLIAAVVAALSQKS